MVRLRSRAMLAIAMVGLLSVLAAVLVNGGPEGATEATGTFPLDSAQSRSKVRGAAIDVHTYVISQALADGLTRIFHRAAGEDAAAVTVSVLKAVRTRSMASMMCWVQCQSWSSRSRRLFGVIRAAM